MRATSGPRAKTERSQNSRHDRRAERSPSTHQSILRTALCRPCREAPCLSADRHVENLGCWSLLALSQKTSHLHNTFVQSLPALVDLSKHRWQEVRWRLPRSEEETVEDLEARALPFNHLFRKSSMIEMGLAKGRIGPFSAFCQPGSGKL